MEKKFVLRPVSALVLALAPIAPAANADIVPITSVNTTTTGTVGDPQTIILNSFTAGGTRYTTATDLVTGTSATRDSGPITNQDHFDFNSYFPRGPSQGDWTTISFGGANWYDRNGDDADFFIFEAGGNDDILVRPIFPDNSVGTYVELTSDANPTMGNTGVTITEGDRKNSNMFGLGFAITDLKDGAGAALTNSSVIKGLEFDGQGADMASISAVPAPDTAITSKNPADENIARLPPGGFALFLGQERVSSRLEDGEILELAGTRFATRIIKKRGAPWVSFESERTERVYGPFALRKGTVRLGGVGMKLQPL